MEDPTEIINTCLKLMKEWKFGFFTTIDQSGAPQTRYFTFFHTLLFNNNVFIYFLPLHLASNFFRLTEPFPAELTPSNDLHIYIGTLSTTRKVPQISHNPTSTMAFHDPNGRGFVVLKGNSTCLEDSDFALREKHWRYARKNTPKIIRKYSHPSLLHNYGFLDTMKTLNLFSEGDM
jgi:general stress protein 26